MNILSKLSRLNIFNIVFFLSIYLIVYFIQYNGISAVVQLIFLIGLALILFDREKGFIYYLIVFFIFDDLPYDIELMDSFASIDNLTIAGQTITKIWSLLWIGFIGSDLLRKKVFLPKDSFRRILLILFLISFLVGILSGGLYYLGPFTNDLRFFINFIIGYFGVCCYVKNKNSLYTLFKLLAVIFVGKLIVLFVQSFLLVGTSEFFTLLGDTGLVISPTFLIMYFILSREHSKLISYAAIFLCILSFGVAAARGRIIVLFIQLLLFFYLIGKLRVIPVFLASITIAFLLLPLINESMYLFLMWKLESFTPQYDSGESSLVRVVEYKNIIAQNLRSFHEFIFGQGLGGSWNSKLYPYGFNLYDTDSYPAEWIRNDRYFKPHGVIQFIILKFGFLGIFLIYGSLAYNYLKLKKEGKRIISIIREDDKYLRMMFLFFTSICTLFLISYSSKHQLFMGIFLASFSLLRSNFLNKFE